MPAQNSSAVSVEGSIIVVSSSSPFPAGKGLRDLDKTVMSLIRFRESRRLP